MSQQQSPYTWSASVEHIKGLLGVLTCIRQHKKQVATLVVDAHGVLIYASDDARTMQGCAHFRKEVFRDFSYTPADNAFRKCFNVNLSNLVNSLSVFSSSDGHANLSLRWPDRDGRLLLQLNALRDADGVGTMVDSCTYAEVSCEECTFAEDLEGELTQARSQFTLQSSTLREIVEDLEWAAAPVTVDMQREPPSLTFIARSDVAGDVKVALDTGIASPAVQSFECIAHRHSSRFAHKFLRIAACMPHALTSSTGGTSEGGLSRLQLDRQGILKIQHLLHMAGKPHGMHAAQPSTVHMHMQPGSSTLEVPDPSPTMPTGSLHHHGHAAPGVAGGQPQPGGGSAHITLVTFVLFPQEADGDEAVVVDDGPQDGAAAMHRQPVSPEV